MSTASLMGVSGTRSSATLWRMVSSETGLYFFAFLTMLSLFVMWIKAFSLECRNKFAFAFVLHYYTKCLALKIRATFSPNQKTKTKRDSIAHVFPRFAWATFSSHCDWFAGLSMSFVIG